MVKNCGWRLLIRLIYSYLVDRFVNLWVGSFCMIFFRVVSSFFFKISLCFGNSFLPPALLTGQLRWGLPFGWRSGRTGWMMGGSVGGQDNQAWLKVVTIGFQLHKTALIWQFLPVSSAWQSVRNFVGLHPGCTFDKFIWKSDNLAD